MRFSIRAIFMITLLIALALGGYRWADSHALWESDVQFIQLGLHQRELLHELGPPHEDLGRFWVYRVWGFGGTVQIRFDADDCVSRTVLPGYNYWAS